MNEPYDEPDAMPVLDDTPSAAAPEPEPGPDSFGFSFSGSGAEYFRIWIVNLLLTVVTLGIYSAWAKTRRLQYFYRNTHLAGASFDFRGDPKAILRGRLLATALVAAYHYAFGFSAAAGAVTVALLIIGMPFLMRSALRFRLSNTWYRGLPFGFAGGIGAAYRVYLLPVAMFVVPGALLALAPNRSEVRAVFLIYLIWPLMHGAMKRYQHRNLMYGDQRSEFGTSSARLAKPYLTAYMMGIVATVVFGALMYALFPKQEAGAGARASMLAIFGGVLLFYLFLIASGLFVMVRMNNMAWSNTRFPGVQIESRMRLRSYFGLQLVNVVLTLLTLGLFRPFAAVRTWRYRLAHVRVEAPGGLDAATGQAGQRPASAAGDGSADFLGLDISW